MKYLSEEQNKCFVGTGELNKAGESLAVFLDKYDPNKYQNPCNTVDTVVFTKKGSEVKRVLLIKRGNHPSIGLWACPGGFVEFKENLYDAALRELQEETGLHDIEAEQFKSYGDYDRDPRTRIITTAFVALIDEGSQKAQAGDDAREAGISFKNNSCMVCCQSVAINNLISTVLKNTLSIGNFYSCTYTDILISIGQPAQPFFFNL